MGPRSCDRGNGYASNLFTYQRPAAPIARGPSHSMRLRALHSTLVPQAYHGQSLYASERPPASVRHLAARTHACSHSPGRECGIFSNFSLEQAREQAHLDLQQPPVAHSIVKQGMRHHRIHAQFVRPVEAFTPLRG